MDNTFDNAWFERPTGGIDTVLSSATSYMLNDHLENLTLLPGAVTGTGNELGNILTGSGGSNYLYGLGGDDTHIGVGYPDFLHGGSGNDRFIFNLTSDSTPSFRDQIQDNDPNVNRSFEGPGDAAGDLIGLSAIDANELLADNQTFIFDGTATTGETGHVWLAEGSFGTLVRANVDADATVEFELAIVDGGGIPASAHTAADFIL